MFGYCYENGLRFDLPAKSFIPAKGTRRTWKTLRQIIKLEQYDYSGAAALGLAMPYLLHIFKRNPLFATGPVALASMRAADQGTTGGLPI